MKINGLRLDYLFISQIDNYKHNYYDNFTNNLKLFLVRIYVYKYSI